MYRPPIVRFLGLTFGGRYNFQCVSRLFILSGLWLFPAISPDLYSNSHKVFPYRFLPLILPLLLLIDGEMDDYPEAAFFNVGTIDDVIEKAKTMAGESSAN